MCRSDEPAEALIAELLSDPATFDRQGRAYDLLQAFFQGAEIGTLRPLLASQDAHVRRTATWVASELGIGSIELIHDVLPLLDDVDQFVRYHALETIAVCSRDAHVTQYVNVIHSLESEDEVIRQLAMRLMSRATVAQLVSASKLLGTEHDSVHKRGLHDLMNPEGLTEQNVRALLNDDEPLLRRYGAIVVKRLHLTCPQLLVEGASSADSDVSKFCSDAAE